MADTNLSYLLSLSQEQRKSLCKSFELLDQIFEELSTHYSQKIIFAKDYDWEINRRIWHWLYFDMGLFGAKQIAKSDTCSSTGEIFLNLTKNHVYGFQVCLQMGRNILPFISKKNSGTENQFPQSVGELLLEFDWAMRPIKSKIYNLVFA